MAPSSFLDELRAQIPAPPTAGGARKRPASLPSARSGKANAPAPPLFAYQDPFLDDEALWRVSLPTHAHDLLDVLAVDHAGLQAANEREAAAGSVAAVLTKKKGGDKKKKKEDQAEPPSALLLRRCAQYAAANSGNCFLTALELAEAVLQTVKDHPRDADTVQSQLFGLVGVEGMDVIAFTIQNQAVLAGESVTRQSLQDAQAIADAVAAGSTPSLPAVASGFSIQTEAEQQYQKQQRKAQRKAARHNPHPQDDQDANWLEAAGYDPEVLRLQRELAQEEMRNQSTSLLQREFGSLAGGYDTTGAAGQLASAGMLSLPSNTKRTHFKGYEHVFIPAHAKKALDKRDKLVLIDSLEAFAQTAFEGITSLNRLQSKLFDAAYHSNQNLLVCAPTGAGKTNVAMLTILQQVRSHLQRHESQPRGPNHRGRDSSDSALAHMKIIYVAPMKALAQEVVTKFGQRLRALKLQVAELTGDMQLTKKEIEQTHVIVTTPEKWDVITRKSSTQQALLSQVKLLIIDEVHLLADERGPVIETIVARTLRRVESTQSMIRIVGLSATLPNYVDVATFLRVYVPGGDANAQNAATNGGKGGLFFFDSTYRPVPLDQTFIGVSTNASLKDALGLSAAAVATTVATEEDIAKEKRAASSSTSVTMSRQRQVQLMMNKLALVHCVAQVKNGEQVMVFVHSRKETAATMHAILELARNDDDDPGLVDLFLPPPDLQMPQSLADRVARSRNKELKELLTFGLGIHHAGMLRNDRNLSEELFERGFIRTLCCTATLAWGVNLPAHSVLIKGTQVYNADKGGMTQLSMLDVMQIFGRAGRPQYDSSGDAVLVTTQDQLPHYLRLLTTGIPMESALIKALPDHLNAEIVSGTVSNLDEACEWLSYTYLFVRMKKNPLAYGLKLEDVQQDPLLVNKRKQLLMDAAEKLASCRMIKILREKPRGMNHPLASGGGDSAFEGKIAFAVTSMGRVASHFYIQHTSIETFNDLLDSKAGGGAGGGAGGRHAAINDGSAADLDDDLEWERVLLVLCSSNEFEQLKSREDEMPELEKLRRNFCRLEVLGGGIESYMGKTSVLLQGLISRARVSSFTLISDTNYVAQNASRVCRALFEICLKKNSGRKAEKFLQLAKCIDQRVWWDQNPLLQLLNVPMDVVTDVERRHLDIYEACADPDALQLSVKVKKWITSLPFIDIDGEDDRVRVQPHGGNMVKLTFSLRPLFPEWKDHPFCGKTLGSWIWVEDAVTGYIYHSEYYVMHASRFAAWKAGSESLLDVECYLPIFLSGDRQEAAYVIRVLSDRFVGMESYYEVSYAPDAALVARMRKEKDDMYTPLLNLHPQPLSSLGNPALESLYAPQIRSLNAIQTQTFHHLYHQDGDALICAPTGSGKTLCAELAMLRVWNKCQHQGDEEASASASAPPLIVYVAPLKALAQEKAANWKQRFEGNRALRVRVVECFNTDAPSTGSLKDDPDLRAVVRNRDAGAFIVVTTPEKWDELTRHSTTGSALMERTELVVVDELHLLGDAAARDGAGGSGSDRSGGNGALMEVLISRLRRFSRRRSSDQRVRFVGLSTTLANARDVGQWLGVSSSPASTRDRGGDGQIFNFRATSRPVSMDVHIQGFPERHFVSRMAAMNKPVFMSIATHARDQPALVFVSSKAQTKLTALDLISFCVSHVSENQSGGGGAVGGSGGSKRYLRVDESVMDAICASTGVADETLKHTLSFGIGLLHGALAKRDRDLVERLFRDGLIQVVIATSDFAWSGAATLPAKLVVVKGTDWFQNGRYRSYPLSDVLQMIGRAGRPLLDDKGVACVLVEENKKNMTQRSLHEPPTLESSLAGDLANHLNAEIASGAIQSGADAMDYLSWTLLFQRVLKNPSYYGIQGASGDDDMKVTKVVEKFLGSLVRDTLDQLSAWQCCDATGTAGSVRPTALGHVAAALYVDVRTVYNMASTLKRVVSATTTTTKTGSSDSGAASETSRDWTSVLLAVLCEASTEIRGAIPLRHHEVQSQLVAELCARVPFSPLTHLFVGAKKKQKALLETHGSQVKAFLLLQMHLTRARLPSSDFANDMRMLLDLLPRLWRALVDVCALLELPELVLAGIRVFQALTQAQWPSESTADVSDSEKSDVFTQLPHVSAAVAELLRNEFKVETLAALQDALSNKESKRKIVERLTNGASHEQKKPRGGRRGGDSSPAGLSQRQVNDLVRAVEAVPRFEITATKQKAKDGEIAFTICVDVAARNFQANALAPSGGRLQRAKPYGFYVVVTAKAAAKEDAKGDIVFVKHLAWKKAVRTTVSVAKEQSEREYAVHVLSDAISGVDATVSVAQ